MLCGLCCHLTIRMDIIQQAEIWFELTWHLYTFVDEGYDWRGCLDLEVVNKRKVTISLEDNGLLLVYICKITYWWEIVFYEWTI
jgi:hypothetical protein